MKGDFSNITFNPQKHFSRVLMQQGRVQLDADWNEQVSILLHYMQTLTTDLIGPHGGPSDGFKIQLTPKDSKAITENTDLEIGTGHYYVAGILCENEIILDENANEVPVTYKKQLNYPLPDKTKLPSLPFLVYLDVWERDITMIEDPEIQEVALGGADTATRSQVVWQVKIKEFNTRDSSITVDEARDYQTFLKKLGEEVRPGTGRLRARVKKTGSDDSKDPCIISPDARYRGAENQLYRVEIHQGSDSSRGLTFKWSRDNGSVVFPIQHLSDTTVTLENLGRESRFGLAVGDWVEIVDDDYVLQGQPQPLFQVDKIDPIERRVILKGTPASAVGQDPTKHPFLRRWNSLGEISVTVSTTKDKNDKDVWIVLEDGIEIAFEAGSYKSGDYWIIPARTVTGDINWPRVKDKDGNLVPVALPPRGVQHYYAPLAVVLDGAYGLEIHDCRYKFKALAQPSIDSHTNVIDGGL
jgi:hypothetical protein